MATSSSSHTGQRGLLPLPSKSSVVQNRNVSNYTVPDHWLVSSTANFASPSKQAPSSSFEHGLPVLKISKNGKLQQRRLAFSPDRRNILVTSHKFSLKNWWTTRVLPKTPSSLRRGSHNNNTAANHGATSDDPNLSSPIGSSNNSNNNLKVIGLSAIDRIQRGSSSHRFVLARHEATIEQSKQVLQLLDDKHASSSCLSIVYLSPQSTTNNNNHASSTQQPLSRLGLQTLDLIVPDPNDYEALVTALEDLVTLQYQELQHTNPSLRQLHTVYMELGKQPNDVVGLQDFLKLCERLQVPLKRGVLSILFKEEVSGGSKGVSSSLSNSASNHQRASSPHHNNSSKSSNNSNINASDGKLGFVAIATLLESIHKSSLPSENPVLEKIWQDLVENDPVPPIKLSATSSPPRRQAQRDFDDDDDNIDNIDDVDSALELRIPLDEESISVVSFLSFLRSQQKEFQTSLEQATDLVQVLNQQHTLEDLIRVSSSSHGTNSKLSRPSSPGAFPRATTIPLHSSAQQDRLTKSRFMTYLTSDVNDVFSPTCGTIGSDDMTQPLSHYWIHTSHDTYLHLLPHCLNTPSHSQHPKSTPNSSFHALIQQSAAQQQQAQANTTTTTTITSPSTPGGGGIVSAATGNKKQQQWDLNEQQYMAALLRGVRCLELDVWEGLDGIEPVVALHQPLHNNDRRIPVQVILRVVSNYLDLYPHSFPILLKLENHIRSTQIQLRLSKQLNEILRDKLAKPSLQQQLDTPVTLPSPEALRGKVVLIGKRPKRLFHGAKVCNDDYDIDNDSFHALEKLREASTMMTSSKTPESSTPSPSLLLSGASLPEEEEGDARVVIGFTPKGPIRAAATLGSGGASQEGGPPKKSPLELLRDAVRELHEAQYGVEQATMYARAKDEQAVDVETQASHYTHLSGWTTEQVQQKSLQLQQRGATTTATNSNANTTRDMETIVEEEKSPKEEGLEVHEVLPDFVEGSRGRYEWAAREAMEGAGREAQCHALLKDKENALRMARDNLEMAKQREQSVADTARKARNEALANQEHAEAAKERVVKVRELLKNCKDQTSTAGTVVQTALTEAKISEKRASDAEARAARAQLAAENDRKRADDETRKEEALEMQVNELHDECMKATEATRVARERVEKAASMLERVNEQLKIIETSSQYRSEIQVRSLSDGYTVPREGSFLAKHTTKLEEREMCRELIREASEENVAAEAHRKELQQEFEDRAYQWRIQADQAAQARRAADRSLHLAEELMEQAEEEREAANLRHTARQRAEATVENKDSYRTSLEAQLVEAEKAAAEATNLALQTKKRAEHLAKEANKVRDHTRFEKTIEDLEWERNVAKEEYEAARAEREKKDRIVMDEKRRLDTNAEVCQEAAREAAAETDRAREEQHYQHEAVVAYSEALVARREANDALEKLEELKLQAETKRLCVERAKEYKAKMDTMVEIPLDLARLTLLHSAKHYNWSKSMSLSNAHVHSFAHNVLLLMLDKNPEEERRNLHSFTKNHLTRIFPSWKALQNKSFTNYDPVFAWSLGCQLVSSNLHSTDESLLVVDGRFRQNGSCGYVLKPLYLTDNISKLEHDQRWSIQIVSGHYLPRPSSRKISGLVSPLVKISIYSGSPKETRISYRTKAAKHVGLNPVWTSHNKFELVIPNPSISMIAFSVWHVQDDGSEIFMGASSMPAHGLREGLRSIALFDEHHSRLGEFQSACILVKTLRK